jgi:hypothetical protein
VTSDANLRLTERGWLQSPYPGAEVLGAVIHKRYRVYRKWQAGLPHATCRDTFRAAGITTCLQNGGTIEHAQQIANHESPRTLARLPPSRRATKLADRSSDAIGLDEIRRILIQMSRTKSAVFVSETDAPSVGVLMSRPLYETPWKPY